MRKGGKDQNGTNPVQTGLVRWGGTGERGTGRIMNSEFLRRNRPKGGHQWKNEGSLSALSHIVRGGREPNKAIWATVHKA